MPTQSKTSDPYINEWPRITRFYGLTPFELQHFPRWLSHLYLDAIPALDAEEQLARMQASDFPHIEQSDRNEMHDRLVRIVQGAIGALEKPEDPVAQQDLLASIPALESMGIGVVIENA